MHTTFTVIEIVLLIRVAEVSGSNPIEARVLTHFVTPLLITAVKTKFLLLNRLPNNYVTTVSFVF